MMFALCKCKYNLSQQGISTRKVQHLIHFPCQRKKYTGLFVSNTLNPRNAVHIPYLKFHLLNKVTIFEKLSA